MLAMPIEFRTRVYPSIERYENQIGLYRREVGELKAQISAYENRIKEFERDTLNYGLEVLAIKDVLKDKYDIIIERAVNKKDQVRSCPRMF